MIRTTQNSPNSLPVYHQFAKMALRPTPLGSKRYTEEKVSSYLRDHNIISNTISTQRCTSRHALNIRNDSVSYPFYIPARFSYKTLPPRRKKILIDPIPKTTPSSFISPKPLFTAILTAFIAGLTFFNHTAECQEAGLSFEELKQLSKKLGLDGVRPEEQSSACLERAYQKCQEGDWKTIKCLASLLARLTDSNGNTLLGLAIRSCDPQIVQKLLEMKIGIKEKNSMGNTPLHLAAHLNAFPVLPELLKAYDPNMRNERGETPIHIALEKGYDETLKFLIEKTDLSKHSKDGDSLLHFAVSCGQFQMIDYLLSKHWEKIAPFIESPNAQGLTPVSLAAHLGEAQALYLLAKKGGANIEAIDSKRNTPLHYACLGGQQETIDALFMLGADYQVYNENLETPQDLASPKLQTHLKALRYQQSLPKDPTNIPIKNLVFQGGGSKGLAYIPVIEHLEEKKILDGVERIAGASAGAITATLLAVGYSASKIKEFMEEQKLSDFLDPAEGITPQFQKDINTVILYWCDHSWSGYLLNKAVQGFKINQKGGSCSGEVFRLWIEDKIEKVTGIKYCTFRELEERVRQGKAKHLHLFGTKLGDYPQSLEINSIDKEWKDVIISDAVRLSMSIPLVYYPHPIYRKNSKGEREIWEEKGYFIDGGLLNNFPIHTFDFKRYKNVRQAQEDPKAPWHNPHTLGFSLYSPPPEKSTENKHDLLSVSSQLPSLYMNAEMIHKEHEEKSMERVIRINNQNISLFTFDIDPKTKEALLKEADNQVKAFFKNYSLTKLAQLDLPYNYALFKEKEANGTAFLNPLSSQFSGRENELQLLEKELLQESYREKVTQVALVGDRGYGKSELALAFAFLHLDHFSLIWTLDYRNPEALETSYLKLAKALKIPISSLSLKEIQKEVKKALENQPKPWLLIFDNVDQEEIPLSPERGGAILFTSTQAKTFETKNPLRLTGLTEGKTLIEKILQREDPEISALVQDLKAVPLLLHQAGNYINANQMTISDYRSLLKQNSSKPLSNQTYPELLKTVWKIASQGLQSHNKEAYDWLIAISFLDSRCIPKDWLEAFIAVRQKSSPLKSHLEGQEILNFLKNYGLISFYKYDQTFSLHGYFQEIIRPTSKEILEELVPFLLSLKEIKDYNSTSPEASLAFQKVAEHVMTVVSHIETPSKGASRLGLTLVRYLTETSRDLAKGDIYLTLTKKLTPQNHPAQGRVAFFAGILAKKRAEYQQALKHFQDAYDFFAISYPLEDYLDLEQNPIKCNPSYQKSICLEYQGQMLSFLRQFEQARNKLKEALKELKALYPSGIHFDIARIQRDRGKIFLLEGNPSKAVQKIKKALELQKKVYEERFESHSTVAATHTELAEAYRTKGTPDDLREADNNYAKAIAINERAFLTEINHYIARIYGKRAEIAEALGELENAEKFKKKKQEIEEAIAKQRANF